MKRGELWTMRGDPPYANKPRPVLVVQSDGVSNLKSTVLCLVTSSDGGSEEYRVAISPTLKNGLVKPSWVMVDELYSASVSEQGERIGILDDAEMKMVSEKLKTLLGLD